jgi:vacuolar protein sorting-associated protein 8
MSSQFKKDGNFPESVPHDQTIDDYQEYKENGDAELLSNDSKHNIPETRSSSALELSMFHDYSDLRYSARQTYGMTQSRQLGTANPLDLLHKKEIQQATYSEKNFKTYLEENIYLESKLPVIQFEELKLISIKIAPSSSYNSTSPSALAASTSLVLIGNTSGQITVFNHAGQELLKLKSKKGLGQVACIDITQDEAYAIAGYHYGQLCLWDLKTGKSKKLSNNFHKKPVLAVKFWKGAKENAISGDLTGKVLLIEFQKSLISTSMNTFELFKDEIGPIVSIEPLVPDPSWPHPTDTDKIVAIAGLKKVVIYTLEPQIKNIFTIDKPIGVPEWICPCISWKLAMTHDDTSPLHYILAVAWQHRIVLYTLKFAGSEGIFISGYLETDAEIKALFWLSYEILLAVINSREIRVISSRKFSNKLGDSNRRAILEETYSNRDLAMQAYIKVDNKDNFTYHNTLKSNNRTVFLLGNKDFHKGQLLDWNECIEELTKKNSWMDVLALGLNLYQGKGKKLYGVPRNRDELRSILQDYAVRFSKVVLIPWSIKIPASIEYCVGIEALEYFFFSLFNYFADQGPESMELLASTLEPYILSSQIISVPPESLDKLIRHYISTKQQNNIERLIVHLEPVCIDPRSVLPICEDHNLLTAYIFINTNSTMQSFVNPLKKIYKTMIKQKDPKPKIYFTYKLLWYYSLCLKAETFPLGNILPEMVQIVISGIVNWILKRKHLQTLLQQDSTTTLNVLWQVFDEEVPCEVMNKRLEGTPSYMDIISKLESICLPGSFLYHQYNLFVLKTADLNHVTISKEICIEVSKYTLRNNKIDTSDPVTGKDIEEYIINYSKQTDKNQLFAGLSLNEKSVLLLKMLKKHKLDYKDLDELYRFAEPSPFTEVLIYLLELRKEYSRCVNYYIECSNFEVKKKVFVWVNELHKKLSEEEKENLKVALMNSLNELVEIDSDQTAKFVTEWYQNKHLEVVKKLDKSPKLQMKYLGELVKDPIEEDLVFKYIVLLCQNDPKKVLPFLQTRDDYNLDKCLDVCNEYHVIEAAAYLNEKLGNVKGALDLLLKRAEDYTAEYIANTKLYTHIDSIEQDVKESIALCSRNVTRLDTGEIKEYLFMVLDAVLTLNKEFKDFFTFNASLENRIHVCIKDILEQAMSVIDFDKIISHVIQKFDKIPFRHFKENIFQTLSQHSYQKNIVRRAINLLNNDMKIMTNNLFKYQSRGVVPYDVCMKCNSKINSAKKQKIVVFICGHGFHKKCIKEIRCNVCSAQEQNKGRVLVSN